MPAKTPKSLFVSASLSILLAGSSLIQAAPAVPVIDRAERNAAGSASSGSAVSKTAVTETIVPVQGANVTSGPRVSAQQTSTSSGPLVPAPRGASGPMPSGELLVLVEQLQEEVQFLRGKVEEQAHRMKQMQSDQRDRYRDLDRRIANISRQLSERSAAPVTLSSSDANNPSALKAPSNSSTQAAASSADAGTGNSVPSSSISDTEAYKAAFSKVRGRQYSEALAAFADFRKRYPDSPLLPNTLYWSGEVYRAKTKPEPEKAKEAFQELIERYPSHQKTPDAYYKLGLSYDDLGDMAKAKEIMGKVVELYEGRVPAQLAKDFLGRSN